MLTLMMKMRKTRKMRAKKKIPNGKQQIPDRCRMFTMKMIKTLYSLESKLNKKKPRLTDY